jgi:hypothetical protein
VSLGESRILQSVGAPVLGPLIADCSLRGTKRRPGPDVTTAGIKTIGAGWAVSTRGLPRTPLKYRAVRPTCKPPQEEVWQPHLKVGLRF